MKCKLDDLTIHYEVRGEGKPLLLLHGISLDHRHMMTDFEPLFADRPGWLRIYPDLPGHGRTPAPTWMVNHDQVFDAVLRFVDQVLPEGRMVIAGTSWGGILARPLLQQKFARVDGVCFIVTPIDFLNLPEAEPIVIVANPALVAEAEALDLRAGKVLRDQPVQVPEVLAWWLNNSRPAKELWDRDFDRRLFEGSNLKFSFDIDTLPQPFAGPTLFVMGHQDVIPYYEVWPFSKNYPRATIAVLDRAGHLAMVHQRKLFNALVSEWLDRVEEYMNR
jgi:pimeloyl-ACP methyl ester carboxylesterase